MSVRCDSITYLTLSALCGAFIGVHNGLSQTGRRAARLLFFRFALAFLFLRWLNWFGCSLGFRFRYAQVVDCCLDIKLLEQQLVSGDVRLTFELTGRLGSVFADCKATGDTYYSESFGIVVWFSTLVTG